MRAYELINEVLEKKNYKVLKENEWLRLLFLKEDIGDINVENFDKISKISKHSTLEYVKKTLLILEKEFKHLNLTTLEYELIEEVLCWCEVAKCGSKKIRKQWEDKNFLLSIHNIGSAQIYEEYFRGKKPYKHVQYVSTLIRTHGLIGQYLRGEVSLFASAPLASVAYPEVDNYLVAVILNKCIVSGVSKELYEKLENDINETIKKVFDVDFPEYSTYERLEKLRSKAISNGENFEAAYNEVIQETPGIDIFLNILLENCDLWYVEAGLSDFGAKEVLKLFGYLGEKLAANKEITDISFGNLMNLYCDHNGKKVINIFKQRIVEKLLKDFYVFTDIPLRNEHVSIELESKPPVLYVNIHFTEIAESFLEFCTKSTGKDELYDKVIFMACDHFGIRRDRYDRLYNEVSYLQTMDASIEHKKVLIPYITGDTVVDIGPAGGSLMDEIERTHPTKNIIGVDISDNVIQELQARKIREEKHWKVLKGNAFYLNEIFKPGEVDTFIFSSVLHELFSYPTLYADNPFNYEAIEKALKSVYNILPVGGRLIIRDGIMTASDDIRLITFKNPEDIKVLEQYVTDFKGRKIEYKLHSKPNTVIMNVNDAMEFLYTYTWGKESYAQEVQEQFGYFTPDEYKAFVTDCFEGNVKFIYTSHFLQEGYSEHLLDKIEFMDENMNPVNLPDSTFILVAEKTDIM